MKHGLILVDTKYEFGKASDGTIMLVDEVNYSISCLTSLTTLFTENHLPHDIIFFCFIKVHTPDSSRYWISHSYYERFWNGMEPENVDKVLIYSLHQTSYLLCYAKSNVLTIIVTDS